MQLVACFPALRHMWFRANEDPRFVLGSVLLFHRGQFASNSAALVLKLLLHACKINRRQVASSSAALVRWLVHHACEFHGGQLAGSSVALALRLLLHDQKRCGARSYPSVKTAIIIFGSR